MQQLTGAEQDGLLKTLRDPVRSHDRLDEMLSKSELGNLADFGPPSNLITTLTNVISQLSVQYRIVELVEGVLNHASFTVSNPNRQVCPAVENWLETFREEMLRRKKDLGLYERVQGSIEADELPYLIDRQDQIRPFRKCIDRVLKDRPRTPVVVILYGEPYANHPTLVKRLRSPGEGLPRLPARNLAPHLRVTEHIHREGDEEHLLSKLCELFGADPEDASGLLAALQRGPDRYDLLTVEIEGPSGGIADANFAFIDRLLAFWDAIKPPPELQIVTFVCIRMEETRSHSFLSKWFKGKKPQAQFKEQLQNRFGDDHPRVLTLPELVAVDREEVALWKNRPDVESYYRSHGVRTDENFIQKVFRDFSTLHLDQIADRLDEILRERQPTSGKD